MVLTLSYIEEAFKKYNVMYFDNSLPLPKFEIMKKKTHLGEFQACRRLDIFANPLDASVIRISIYYDREAKDFDETIIHEMIHYYISHNCIVDNGSHGKQWKKKAAEINAKGGWNITRTTSVRGVPRNPSLIKTKKSEKKPSK